MNKADKICMMIIIVLAFALYIPLWISNQSSQDKIKQAIVHYRDKEVLRIDLSKDGKYHVSGTLADVQIEVRDEAIRVEKETSPYHLCSKQGWVKDVNQPIICLPNDIVVNIEAKDDLPAGEDTVVR